MPSTLTLNLLQKVSIPLAGIFVFLQPETETSQELEEVPFQSRLPGFLSFYLHPGDVILAASVVSIPLAGIFVFLPQQCPAIG